MRSNPRVIRLALIGVDRVQIHGHALDRCDTINAATPMITIDPPSPLFPAKSKAALSRFLARARTLIQFHGSVEVLLTSDAELKRLNRTFRRKNKSTDILSFPAPPGFPQLSGDLAISLDTAAKQAAAHAHPLGTELRILLLHGLLHLAGEDHETDTGQMAAREESLRKQLRLPISLTERARP